jgi:hypothetical protein
MNDIRFLWIRDKGEPVSFVPQNLVVPLKKRIENVVWFMDHRARTVAHIRSVERTPAVGYLSLLDSNERFFFFFLILGEPRDFFLF